MGLYSLDTPTKADLNSGDPLYSDIMWAANGLTPNNITYTENYLELATAVDVQIGSANIHKQITAKLY